MKRIMGEQGLTYLEYMFLVLLILLVSIAYIDDIGEGIYGFFADEDLKTAFTN